MTDKWLLSEYMMLLQTQNGGKVIVDTRPALELQIKKAEPLIRADEAKKFEGWKSPKEVKWYAKEVVKVGRTKTLKEVGEWLELQSGNASRSLTTIPRVGEFVQFKGRIFKVIRIDWDFINRDIPIILISIEEVIR